MLKLTHSGLPSVSLSPLFVWLCLSLLPGAPPAQPSTPLHRPSRSAARASHKWVRAPEPALAPRSCQTIAVLSASTRPRTWTRCKYTSWTAYSNPFWLTRKEEVHPTPSQWTQCFGLRRITGTKPRQDQRKAGVKWSESSRRTVASDERNIIAVQV